MIRELQPINFRAGSHYVQLLLMAFAFFAVGRARKIDVFKLLLLSIAGAVAFRTMRDAWFICVPAAACIADSLTDENQRTPAENWREKLAVAAVVAVSLVAFAGSTDFNTRGLDRAISGFLPVNAANYLRQNPAPGPLYNTLDWGGFLIWYMPDYPVAIDGRTDLYGDELDEQFFTTANGAPFVHRRCLPQSGRGGDTAEDQQSCQRSAGGLTIPTRVPGPAGGGFCAQRLTLEQIPELLYPGGEHLHRCRKDW